VSSACEWLGAALPANPIDGHDIRPLILGERGAKSPWDTKGFAYYNKEQLQAVRAGPWKLYLGLEKKHPQPQRQDDGIAAATFRRVPRRA